MQKQYSFSTSDLFNELQTLKSKGVTELYVHDSKISADKKSLLAFIDELFSKAPELFVTLNLEPSVLDANICRELEKLFCTVEINLFPVSKGEALLFDKKLYSSKAELLNKAGLVFGFNMNWGCVKNDTYKAFRDRLDFALSLYPNHIDFEQLEKDPIVQSKPSGVFSSKDMDYSRDIAFACQTFYSAGRAVPWFNSILKPLKISPSVFFADFAEWQRCSSCSSESNFNPYEASHKEIEKMQFVFLKQKYEEKHRQEMFLAASDLIVLNGAFSRVACEGEECIIETSYNPDDLLSPLSYDLAKFTDTVCQEPCRVKIFAAADSPDYKIL